MKLFVSHCHDPYVNLAFEESLLHEPEGSAFLWVNDPCVVIGRNQNPYQEADIAYLGDRGIALARRLSGGGAVFHDRGNLNYSIVSDEPDMNRAAEWALSSLGKLGVHARRSGRNDLIVGQAKVGGLAEYWNERCLQHGTLMVDVNLPTLERALQPSALKLEKHGITSVGSRVANLSGIVRGVSTDQLETVFAEVLGVQALPARMDGSIRDRAAEFRSFNWLVGARFEGDCKFDIIVEGDLYRFSLALREGVIESAQVSTDALYPPDLRKLEESLEGRLLDIVEFDDIVRNATSAIDERQ